MLTRLRLKRNYTPFIRLLSDKPSDNIGKPLDTQSKVAENEQKKAESDVERLQNLLKSMMTEPKISEAEYREKFATAPDTSRRRKNKSSNIEIKEEHIEHEITKAAEEVAQAIGGDVKHTEAELLSKVLGKINQSSTNLSDLLIGMKVDRTKETDDISSRPTPSRGQQVKHFAAKSQHQQDTRYSQRKSQNFDRSARPSRSLEQPTIVNVFGGQPLGIFKASSVNYGTELDVWKSLEQRELNLATSQPPTNYFQKMILWTEQGKVWKFPINNEQGLEEEDKIHFSEHIFLDSHLEGWCPNRGPVRHFMELVCVGLSMNPFYTAKEKKDHILWYKEYFESKKNVLTEVGAWQATLPSSQASV